MNELEDRSLGVQRLAGEKLHFIWGRDKTDSGERVSVLENRFGFFLRIVQTYIFPDFLTENYSDDQKKSGVLHHETRR